MSQDEILKLLAKYPDRWFSINDISEKLNINLKKNRIAINLKKMRKSKLIEYIEQKSKYRKKVYKYKHKKL